MKKNIIILLILFLTINIIGCASTIKSNPEEILNNALSDTGKKIINYGNLNAQKDLSYIPIVLPPEVERIWIYPHVTPSGELVMGHWIFIKLKEESWYLEDYNSLKTIEGTIKYPLSPVLNKEGR